MEAKKREPLGSKVSPKRWLLSRTLTCLVEYIIHNDFFFVHLVIKKVMDYQRYKYNIISHTSSIFFSTTEISTLETYFTIAKNTLFIPKLKTYWPPLYAKYWCFFICLPTLKRSTWNILSNDNIKRISIWSPKVIISMLMFIWIWRVYWKSQLYNHVVYKIKTLWPSFRDILLWI